jgi:hypothetical protein
LRISLKRDSFKEGYLTLAVKIIISAKELDQESRLFVKAIARTSIVICSFVPLQSTIHSRVAQMKDVRLKAQKFLNIFL